MLFAAGMSLLDAADGCFMNFAYSWAFAKPVRKIYYNITITGLSVAVAAIVGTIELVNLLADKLGITRSHPWTWSTSGTPSSRCSWPPGWRRWPCGGTDASSSAGAPRRPNSPTGNGGRTR